MSSVRALVVDDYKPWCGHLCTLLKTIPGLQVIGEASDGWEAVQKAQALQPDLILLDIGLPKLNGIEAAKRIYGLSPRSKILFVSQETSADIVEEALATGAKGYIVKTDERSELMKALDAVLRGETYVSPRCAERDSRKASDPNVSQSLSIKEGRASR